MTRIARGVGEAREFQPSALTIGNFDGVHIGHRRLIAQVREAARKRYVTPSVLTFDPHPAKVVAPDRAPRLLTSIETRCGIMGLFGIQQILVLPFTRAIANLTPEEFVRDIVAGAMRARVVMVGANFRFGHRQAGDTRVLAELGKQYGFETCIAEVVECKGRVASSSAVRAFIEAGDVDNAWRFLAEPYSIAGEVVPGHGVGSKQTVPTLNLKTSAEVLPKMGVYVTRTLDLNSDRSWNSITNIGYRPTFAEAADELSIETFLLEPLGGNPPERIEVQFLHRVRDERKFENAEALKAQIFRDVNRAQAFFRHNEQMMKG
ncbi:MAG TPA: bifunctional riboflavin kinase/FAD synthetase [Bryobacteraceae bacterium]|nr:bifunctional riboflavin kinase/FAD synthetase [Bryobacteraceae bacterium]